MEDEKGVGDPSEEASSSTDIEPGPSAVPAGEPAAWRDVLQAADAAFLSGQNWHRAATSFANITTNMGLDSQDPLVLATRRALNFALDARASDRARVEMCLAGFSTHGRPGIKSVPPEEVDVWRRVANDATHPATRAHFHDLLFTRGGPDALRHAVEAVRSYLDVARVDQYRVEVEGQDDEQLVEWAEHSRSMAMGRALSLRHVVSRGSGCADLAAQLPAQALTFLNRLIHDPNPHFGDLIMLLRLLVRGRKDLDPAQVVALEALLDTALEKHRNLDHVVDDLVAELIKLNPARAAELRRRRVQTRLELAESQSQGILRMIHLEAAASLARDHGFRDLHDEAVRLMQRGSFDDLGMQTFSHEFGLPAEVVSAEVMRASDGSDWRDALTSWLETGPPSGKAESNRESVRHLNRTTLMGQLGIPTIAYGRDGLPRWTATTPEEREEQELAKHELRAVSFNGMVLAEALDTIAQRHGIPSEDELTIFLSHNGLGDATLARTFARALICFWQRDFEGALLRSALRIEAGARNLALTLDEPAYVTRRQNAPAVYLGLAQLVDLLEKHGFDEDWKRFLLTCFVSPTGRSLRHDLAHGFGPDNPEPQVEAALSLRALGLFVYASWQPNELALPPAEPNDAGGTGIVEAVCLLAARLKVGIPLKTLVRHEASSLRRIVTQRRKTR